MQHTKLVLYFIIINTIFFITRNYSINNLGIDDSYIFFRYVNNFFDSGDFVWNKSSELVEGFSSWLWMILLVGAKTLNFNLTTSSFIINIAISFACSIIMSLMIIDLSKIRSNSVFFYSSLLILCPAGTYFWMNIGLMDTTLWIFLFLLSIYRILLKSKYILPLCLLALCRPEGYALSFIMLALSFSKPNKYIKDVFILSFAIISQILIRLYYFGYIFPNTYYAKVEEHFTSEGLNYIIQSIKSNPEIIISFITLILLLATKKVCLRKILTLIIPSVFIFFFSYYVGGDHFTNFRFIQPIIVLAIAINLLGVLCLIKEKVRPLLFFLLFCISLFKINFAASYSTIDIELMVSRNGSKAAKFLNKIYKTNLPTIAAIPVGALGFHYKGNIYDMVGLNQTKMTHQSKDRIGEQGHAIFDPQIFLEDMPEILIDFGLSCKPNSARVFIFSVLKNLRKQPEFIKNYIEVFYKTDEVKNLVCGYVRKDFFNKTHHSVEYFNPQNSTKLSKNLTF